MDRGLWSADELVVATGGQYSSRPRGTINGVSIDSRNLAPGDLFVAIKGDKMDGHDFVEAALKNGAGVAMVSRATPAMQAAGPVLTVADDPLRGLENIGRAARARSGAQIIAVTGSVGKTSTKEMLAVALAASGETHASAASYNNHWGVPLTLSRLSREAAFGIFEIGMNHSGEISPLVAMVRPHIAIVTSIAPSHLGNFKSLDEIADAKAEIFTGVVAGGSAIINRDTPYFERLAETARKAGIKTIIGFGRHEKSDVRLLGLALHPACCCVTVDVMGEICTYRLGLPGEHMALNSLAVLAAAKLAGADLARAALALAEAKPAKGRGVQQSLRMPGGALQLIDESYNANPTSVRAALALLKQARPGKAGRRIAVLGDMLELGDGAAALHAGLGSAVDEAGVDILYAAGPLMAHLWNDTPVSRRGAYAEKSDALVEPLLNSLRPGDVVMVKGSLGSRMGPIVEAMKSKWPLADRDV